MNRRGFLQLAGATAALGSLAAFEPRVLAAAPLAPGGFFSGEEREILTQVVERMVATGEPGAPPVRETRAIEVIDGLCAGLDASLTQPLPALLRLVEWGPFCFDLRFARFTRLDDAAKDASLRGWMTSRLALRRRGFQALRNLALFGYWSQQETWPLIGYAGPLLGHERGPA